MSFGTKVLLTLLTPFVFSGLFLAGAVFIAWMKGKFEKPEDYMYRVRCELDGDKATFHEIPFDN